MVQRDFGTLQLWGPRRRRPSLCVLAVAAVMISRSSLFPESLTLMGPGLCISGKSGPVTHLYLYISLYVHVCINREVCCSVAHLKLFLRS